MTTPPAWRPDVAALFAAPSWVDASERSAVAAGWRQCMLGYGIDLADYASVKAAAETIYDHLASRSMPLTTDESQLWPPDALAVLDAWVQAGCPEQPGELGPPPPANVLPVPPPPPSTRVRRNILDLSDAELADYRARIEAIGATTISPEAIWQQLAYVHTDWCLHYQEAFLLWHRANLLLFEALIGMPIPYWDFMDPNVPVDGTAQSGIPQAFKDLTYVDPATGEERPNPLRLAIAKDGQSKVCASGPPPPDVDCRYVQRDPLLYTSGDDQRPEREAKLALVAHFQDQVWFALGWPSFSPAEGAPGYPWANILTFDPPPPDTDYPYRTYFDGLYEQPHDNFHGWIGPDMADNAYTAFDPIFWSYHANIDRVFEAWRRAQPAVTFTADFPLRPFAGPFAAAVDLTDPDAWAYTTIGDMAKDTRALGYDYDTLQIAGVAIGPATQPPAAAPADHLYVLFPDVRCILETYVVDVFLELPHPSPADVGGPHFAGRTTRLGMGVEDERGRCVHTGVTRMLDATRTAQGLGIAPGAPVEVGLLVTHAARGRVAAPEAYADLPGFRALPLWGSAPPVPTRR